MESKQEFSRLKRLNEQEAKRQLRFGIRKFSSIGATSAVIGTLAFLAPAVQAAETTAPADTATVVETAPGTTTEPTTVQVASSVEEAQAEPTLTSAPAEVGVVPSEQSSVQEASPVQSISPEQTSVAEPVEAAMQPQVAPERDYSGFSTTVTSSGLTELAQELVNDANIDVTTLSQEQIAALNKLYVKQAETGSQLTYKDFKEIADNLVEQDPKYAIPYFNASVIENMNAATTKSAQTNEVADLDVWDSWPVQDLETGLVSNWNGYQLVVAMMGVPKTNDHHLYLLYNTYGDNNLQNWKNAGSIFGYDQTAVNQQWSGSAVVNSDGTIQLYYTDVDTSDNYSNNQKLASVTLNLEVENNEVVLKSIDNRNILTPAGGDGYYYQSYAQWRSTFTGTDNIAMRDPHIKQDEDGNRYLIFEASTGQQNYQGDAQVYNVANYGGDAKFITSSLFRFLENDDMYQRARFSNAALGIVRLGGTEKNPTIEEYMTPLVSAPMVSDEIERPGVVKLGEKYYLFAASRLNHGSNNDAWMETNQVVGDNVVMLGWVSDSLTSGYTPLNGSSVVLTASVPADWRTATYSYYAVPVEGYNDRLLITAYMTNRNGVAGDAFKSTWAPSFLIQVLPDGTTRVLAEMTEQGDWIWDESSRSTRTAGTLVTSHLPGENDGYIDFNLIGGYGLVPHMPVTPEKPITPPTVPVEPTTPLVPSVPGQPDNPGVPSLPKTSTPSLGKDTPVVSASALPVTGDVSTNLTALIGFALMTSMTSYLAYAGYKRKEQ